METEWKYFGDVNLKYGGYFYRYDVNDKGFPYYTDIIRVTDLDSACGADGLVMIEKLTTFNYGNKARVKSALSCIGFDLADLRGRGKSTILDIITDAFLAYGYYDPAGDYRRGDITVLVTADYTGNKKSWDGWGKYLDKDLTVSLAHDFGGDLRGFVMGEWNCEVRL